MKIYNYDPITFIYTFSENADLDPEETKRQGKNVYLLPANATFIKPPVAKEDKVRVFNENQWEYISDYRKNYDKVNSNLNVFDITEIGEIEEGYALVTKELGELIKVNPNDYVFENDSVREKTEQEKGESTANHGIDFNEVREHIKTIDNTDDLTKYYYSLNMTDGQANILKKSFAERRQQIMEAK